MKWFEIKAKGNKAEVWIYEFVGQDFWTGDGVTAKAFQKELSDIKSSQIDLHINSPGGDVFDGITIYNLLKQHPANITTYVDGLAASIASVIALAGDQIYMAENALMMIHNPYGITMGNADDMRQMADRLDKVRSSISSTYISKTGKTEEEIHPLMDAETWLSADEALDLGFIDEITGKIDMAACAKFIPVMAKAGFKKIPETITPKQMPTAKDADKGLRNVGFSRKQTKLILAKGISEYLRNVDMPDDPEEEDETLRNVEEMQPGKMDVVASSEEQTARKPTVNELTIKGERMGL